jgi:hypothetical protein
MTQLAQRFCLVLFIGLASLAIAQTRPSPVTPLPVQRVRGDWQGAKDGVVMRFSWDGKAKKASLIQQIPSATVSAGVTPQPNDQTGAVDLRLDYKNLAGLHSAVIATISPGDGGMLVLTMLPIVQSNGLEFVTIENVPLRAKEIRP